MKIYALISAKAIFYGEEHVLEKTDAESVPLIHYSDRAVEFSHAVERHELPLKLFVLFLVHLSLKVIGGDLYVCLLVCLFVC